MHDNNKEEWIKMAAVISDTRAGGTVIGCQGAVVETAALADGSHSRAITVRSRRC